MAWWAWWRNGKTSDLRSRGHGFDSLSSTPCRGHYKVATTWTDDCLQTGKPSVSNQHQDQLNCPSLRGRQIEYQLLWLGSEWGTFT